MATIEAALISAEAKRRQLDVVIDAPGRLVVAGGKIGREPFEHGRPERHARRSLMRLLCGERAARGHVAHYDTIRAPLPVMTRTSRLPLAWASIRKPVSAGWASDKVMPCRSIRPSEMPWNSSGRLSGAIPMPVSATATCMIVGDNIFAMLLTRERFQSFTPKPVADASQVTEVLVCISLDRRAAVDDMVAAALANGGSGYKQPEDHGFMYAHGFQDPDGHIWELCFFSNPT